jgi:predicted RNase H-like nuclease (RuvC/YqgF family)
MPYSKILADIGAETQTQVDGLRTVVETKRKLLQESREKKSAEMQHLHLTIDALRKDLAKKRRSISEWERNYQATQRRGDAEVPASTTLKILEHDIEHLQVGYSALLP